MPSNRLKWLQCFHRYSSKFMCSSLSRSVDTAKKELICVLNTFTPWLQCDSIVTTLFFLFNHTHALNRKINLFSSITSKLYILISSFIVHFFWINILNISKKPPRSTNSSNLTEFSLLLFRDVCKWGKNYEKTLRSNNQGLFVNFWSYRRLNFLLKFPFINLEFCTTKLTLCELEFSHFSRPSLPSNQLNFITTISIAMSLLSLFIFEKFPSINKSTS